MLQSQRITAITCGKLENQLHRQPAPQVLRTSRTTTVLFESAPDIKRDARIQTPVGTVKYINTV